MYNFSHKSYVYLDLKINSTIIERVVNFVFLTVDANAKWTCHIKHVFTKMSRAIGIIKAVKKTFSTPILITLYNSLILPHIDYR